LSADDALREYKAQQGVERGFRFLKDPLFFTSSVFLKSPKRIAALGMIMALCLLVYNLGQRQLRQALAQQEETIPNQLGQPTATPTLRWVFQCFMAVHLVVFQGVQQVVNLTDERQQILQFFSDAIRRYYLLPTPVS
jgi:transposase